MEKAELIAFLQDEDRQQEEPSTQESELEVPQPLTKRQLKRRRNKNSKLGSYHFLAHRGGGAGGNGGIK